uniref:SUEL-type lectin domain-containing protein n=1 Tax=Oreochromis niloticus TaxID=8128 RepID=A0A669CH96_ORENI
MSSLCGLTETGVILVQESLIRSQAMTVKPPSALFGFLLVLSALSVYFCRCNGKKVCEVTPAIFTTDPCSETFKYLETSYSCVPASESHVCFTERYIKNTKSAVRVKIFKNSLERISLQLNLNRGFICSSARALTLLCIHSCNGRNSCSMRAAPSVFGNSCPNTYKYLELTYTCHSK